jgi:hypothetical protein
MDTSKAAYGLVTHHPLYALMISDGLFPGELPGDPVRALLLVVTLLPDGDSKISKSATRAWHARVKRRDREDGDELEAAIRALLHAPGRSHLDLAIAASQKHPAGYDPDVLRILLGRAHALLIDDRGKSPPESGTRIAIEVAPTPEDCTFIVTQKTASEEEGGGETVMVLPSLAAARFGKRVARLQAVQERDFRTRSLVPGSSASLHGDELDEVLQSLDQALGDDESTSKAFSGNLVAALVTLTTLPRSSIWRGLAELQQGVIPQWLHQAEDGSWSLVVVAIDINSRRSQPAENLISGRSPEAQLYLPLPQGCARSLSILLANESIDLSAEAVQQSFDEVLKGLRLIIPYLTEGRLRSSVAARCFAITGDPAMAMVITGSPCGTSSAPLAYYAPPISKCLELWDKVLNTRRPSSWSAVNTERRFGAPMGAVRDDVFRKVVLDFQREARLVSSLAGNEAELHDAICIYTARLWLAATGHRGQSNIGEIRYVDIIPSDGLSVMPDKPSMGMPGERPVALPPLMLEQLGVLHNLYAKATGVAPNSDTPVFQLLIGGRSIAGEDLEPAVQFNLPVSLFRTRIATKLREVGVFARLIYWQIGHLWLGQQPVSPESIESMLETAKALQPAIQEMLNEDGWRLVAGGERSIRRTLQRWPTAAASRDQGLLYSERVKSSSVRRYRPPAEVANQVEKWVHAQLRSAAAIGATNQLRVGFCVEEHHVENWVRSAAADSAGEQDCRLRLRSLRARVTFLQKRHGWSGLVPPAPDKREHPTLHVAREHLRSRSSIHAWRMMALDPLAWKKVPERARPWIRVTVLLIIEHVVVRRETLSRVLQIISAPPTKMEAEHLASGYLEIDVGGRQPRLVALPRTIATLVRTLIGRPDCPSPEALWRWLKVEDSTLGRDPSLRLFNLARMARRVEMPGVHWERADSGDNGALSWNRAQTDQLGTVGASIVEGGGNELPEDAVVARKAQVWTAEETMSSYRSLRSGLNDLREPGVTKQGVPRARYRKACKLVRKHMQSPQPELINLLCRFFLALLESEDGHAKVRISTAYGLLTDIGRRLILAVGSREITRLEPDHVTEVYTRAVLASPSRIADVLMRFHRNSQGAIQNPDWSVVFAASNESISQSKTRVTYVNAAELAFTHSVLDELSGRIVSERLATYGHVMVDLMCFAEMRPSEVTHLRADDVYSVGGFVALWVTGSDVGLLKHIPSRRRVALTGKIPEVSIARIMSIRGDGPLKERVGEPLFRFEHPSDLELLVNVLRDTLALASGDPDISLYSLRHSGVSQSLQRLLHVPTAIGSMDPALQVVAAARQRGQSLIATGYTYYWHHAHTFARLDGTALTSAQAATLKDISSAAVRQRRRRGSGKKRDQDNEGFPLAPIADRLSISRVAEHMSRVYGSADGWDSYWLLVKALARGRSPLLAARSASLNSHQAKVYLESLRRVEFQIYANVFSRSARDAMAVELGIRDGERRVARAFHSAGLHLRRCDVRALPSNQDALLRIALDGAGPGVKQDLAALGVAAAAKLAWMRL